MRRRGPGSWTPLWSVTGALLAVTSAPAQEPPSTYDRIWTFAQWYRNDENPVIQNLLFSGRFQFDFAALDAEQDSHHEWNVRRLRVGARSQLFRDLTLHGEVELNPQEHDPLYVRLTDVYLQWSRSATLELTLGKHSAPFTMDGSTSSKELLTVDRSNLTNNIWFTQEYVPGVSAAGELAPWTYHVGVYSSGDANREFGRFNGSFFTLVALGFDFARLLGVSSARLTGDYVYQKPDSANAFTRPLEHVVSVRFDLDAGGWSVRIDASGAAGYLGQSDLWGVTAMPFLDLSDRLQTVGRLTWIESRDPHGVRLTTYENRLADGRGDRYRELYLGANWYLYGHKLKLQTGLQLANMSDRAQDGGDYSGVSWTTGLRVSW